MVGTDREKRRSEREVEVQVFAIDNSVIIDLHGELLGAGIGIKLSGQISHRLGALADGGNNLLVITPAFLRRQFGEESAFHVVFSAKIVASDADLRFAGIG